MNIIETENLSKEYKQGVLSLKALSDINIKIPEKAFAALISPSGSGKSTLLNIFWMQFNTTILPLANLYFMVFKPA